MMVQPFVLRMRRMLDGPIVHSASSPGVVLETLGPKPDRRLLMGGHAILESGYWEGGGGAPSFRRWWKALRKDEEFDPALVFLAMDSIGVAGMAQCWTSCFVKDLAVHSRARRRGIGRALMLAAFQEFARRGALHVDLKVREENFGAIALYQALGMRIVGRELSQL